MRRMWALPVLAIALAGAAAPDPDWPCVQRLVPKLTAESVWPGPPPTASWRDDPQLAALVAEIAPRRLPVAAGLARLDAFVATNPSGERRATLFAGLVEQIDAQRSEVIARLHAIGRRQRGLADATSLLTGEIHALAPDVPGERRDEMVGRRAFLIRQYESVDRTIRLACEVPAELEGRLGQFARVLQGDAAH
jgi:hypothetical protein